MATLTVNIPNDKDLVVLREILERFGLSYSVDEVNDDLFTKEEILGFIKTKQDFLAGKTTSKKWSDIEDELNRAFCLS